MKMTKNIHDWLNEYGVSHQNPTNKLIHWICVPAIVFSIIGIIATMHSYLLYGVLAAGLIYYFMLSAKLAIASLPLTALYLFGVLSIITYSEHPVYIFIGIFVTAWIGQFIGHHIEGKRPSFIEDLQFLFIGPIWLLSLIFKKLNIDI